ncbi:wall-associated receptor kinase 5-like [Prosopis cineraria]|uniref:wall-associated receptor kinase 5-like n=1 Tax=Prosopis cineraria TaxID=364024 RepID=UPI00240F2626|nr:wall-associated receptor kinase 5-like [Prosopis cineraria]
MGSAFTISSTENKFINVGCDTYGYLNSFVNHSTTVYSTGCLTRCDTFPSEMYAKNCSGIGCCQVDIPVGMRNIDFEAYSFKNHANISEFNNCSYAFVVKKDWYNFSLGHLKQLPFDEAPLVLNWTVSNVTCDVAKARLDYACTNNTDCVDSPGGFGYNCRCKHGFEGNPYHPDGCHDIDECQDHSMNKCSVIEYCVNTIGGFRCGPKRSLFSRIFIGTSAALVALLFSMSWLYLVYRKRNLIKQKEHFFRQNGGLILQQRLSVKEASSQTAKIFTMEELKRATNNYHDSLILGKGGYGTVYKRILNDNKVVAIKKSKLVDQNQIEQFINEMVILLQINHRNVVKLLGCCLETEIPLLVYEFINNGTLYDCIHNPGKASKMSWETRLKIAAETAEALSYLHSSASTPIIHRDVKPSNILLDDSYTAKVSDFGASRLVPVDQTELATMVQGTLGYLDSEYMQTNQLTEKSDVYSFGVVLVELLTGKIALSFDRPEDERCLAMHFLSSLRKGQLFEVLEVGIMIENNEEILKEVASLAKRCLRLRGDERPSMKEVAMELEGIRMTRKHTWVNNDNNSGEIEPLLGETSGISESGDSISYRNTGDYSITNHVLIDLNDGR